MSTNPNITKTRFAPTEVAPETFLIHDHHGEGTEPVSVGLNSLVIRSQQPVVVGQGRKIEPSPREPPRRGEDERLRGHVPERWNASRATRIASTARGTPEYSARWVIGRPSATRYERTSLYQSIAVWRSMLLGGAPRWADR